jgi:hypothetical protein
MISDPWCLRVSPRFLACLEASLECFAAVDLTRVPKTYMKRLDVAMQISRDLLYFDTTVRVSDVIY